MRKIKILRIIARLNVGGPSINVAILTNSLNDERFDTVLVHGRLDDGEADMSYLLDGTASSYFVSNMVRPLNVWKDLKALLRIADIIRKEKPDIIHTHTAKAGTLGRLAAILTGCRNTVHTYHGHVFSGYFDKFTTWFYLTCERLLASFTSRIITISPALKEELLGKYHIGVARQYNVIPLGFDLEPFKTSVIKKGGFRRSLGLSEDDIIVGMVGRLVPVKNHGMLIKAAGMLKDSLRTELFKRVKFVIIGDGPLRQGLQSMVNSLGLSGQFVFTGWQKDMPAVYSDMDIVALTSVNEGTPVSLIEALASGKNVIATDVGGVRDVVKEDGTLVKSGDHQALSEALKGLIEDDKALIKINENAKERVLEQYSSRRLVDDIKGLYLEIIGQKGNRQ
jgi:glycosyltransferase involved in cell wall biosynthesis